VNLLFDCPTCDPTGIGVWLPTILVVIIATIILWIVIEIYKLKGGLEKEHDNNQR
jgi:hypothetical protein